MKLRGSVLLIALLPLLSVATEMYKWVDSDGNVHFSDRPPEQAQETVEQLELKDDIDPARQAEGQARLEQTQQNLDRRRSSRDRAEEARRQEQAEAEQHAAKRQAQCHLARSNLQVMKAQRPVYSFDENGEQVFIEDEDRAARIAEYEQEVAKFCG